jgi:hypothetical protein
MIHKENLKVEEKMRWEKAVILQNSSIQLGAGMAKSVKRLATGWKFRGPNFGGGETFSPSPYRP